jgi:hypothetical protein
MMMPPRKLYRQGDVFLALTPTIPKTATLLPHCILARGEATGHVHEVIGDAELYERDGTLYLSVRSTAELRHQEHGTVTLPRGAYEVGMQREYTPEGWNRVVD